MARQARWIALLILGAALAGCSGLNSTSTADSSATAPQKPFNLTIQEKAGGDSLSIIKDDSHLRIGDPIYRWSQMFPRPSKLAFSIKELPKSLNQPGLSTAGWESPNRGYGAVQSNQRVVLAMLWESKVSTSRASYLLNLYSRLNRNLQEKIVTEGSSSYYFWEHGGVRMMVYVQKESDEVYDVTISLGQVDLMEAVRASAAQAQEDLASIYPNKPEPSVKIVPPSLAATDNPDSADSGASTAPNNSASSGPPASNAQPPVQQPKTNSGLSPGLLIEPKGVPSSSNTPNKTPSGTSNTTAGGQGLTGHGQQSQSQGGSPKTGGTGSAGN